MASYPPTPSTPPGRSCAKIDACGDLIVPGAPKLEKTRSQKSALANKDRNSDRNNHRVERGRVTKPKSNLKGLNTAKKRDVSVHFEDLKNPAKVVEQFTTPKKTSYSPNETFYAPPVTPRLLPSLPVTPDAPHRCSILNHPCSICAHGFAKTSANANPSYEESLSDDLASVYLVRGNKISKKDSKKSILLGALVNGRKNTIS